MNTLFERAGGFPRIRLIVSEFYQRVLESTLLRQYFAETDMRRLMDHQTQFVAALMGGPASFTDEQIARVHARLGITAEAYDEITTLLLEAMEDAGIAAADVSRVAAHLASLRVHVVSAQPEVAR